MSKYVIKSIIPIVILLLVGSFMASKSYAASLSNASDQLSTSRPSAASPIFITGPGILAAGSTQATVYDLPTTSFDSALWLASDSATFVKAADAGETQESLNVASMSAANTPASNQRIVYFTSATANAHHSGVALITPITATHTIKFTTTSAIPGSGHIVITFPGAGSNIASPSASTFSFNNITSSQIQTNNVTCASWSIAAPTMDCTVNGSGVAAATTVTIEIGCTTNTSGACTSFRPMLINPIKTTGAAGTADQWKIGIKTRDNSSVDLDSTTVVAGIIESVQVQGTVEPYMTMTIAGVANNTSVCSDTTNPGTGLDSTATFVNLGSLSSGQINISAQTITIDTNGSFGYTLTATSAGRFINPASGVYLADANGGNGLTANSSANGTTPSPASLTAGTSGFGIHPCIGSGSTTSPTIPAGWGTGGGASNKYANPWNGTALSGFYAQLASTTVPSATSKTAVEYGASVASTTPAGIYTTVFTYVATAAF